MIVLLFFYSKLPNEKNKKIKIFQKNLLTKWIKFGNIMIVDKTRTMREEKANKMLRKKTKVNTREEKITKEEFDPGSGWTLTECLTHASRLESSDLGGGRVSNA